MIQKKQIIVIIMLLILATITACYQGIPDQTTKEEPGTQKISNTLLTQVEMKKEQKENPTQERINQMKELNIITDNLDKQRIIIYLNEEITDSQIKTLEELGIVIYAKSLVPLENELEARYILADMPLYALEELAGKEFIIKLDTAEIPEQEPEQDMVYDEEIREPSTPPHISGILVSKTTIAINEEGTENIKYSILVAEGLNDDNYPYKDHFENLRGNAIWFSVTRNTQILNVGGREVQFSDLKEGHLVDVWHTGFVAESYPGQAIARKIKIKGARQTPTLPDLTVTELSVRRIDSSNVAINYCIKNIGGTPTGSFHLKFTNLDNPTHDFGESSFSSFPPGKEHCGTSTRSGVGINGGNGYIAGDNRIEVFVDSRNQVKESNEDNNKRVYTFNTGISSSAEPSITDVSLTIDIKEGIKINWKDQGLQSNQGVRIDLYDRNKKWVRSIASNILASQSSYTWPIGSINVPQNTYLIRVSTFTAPIVEGWSNEFQTGLTPTTPPVEISLSYDPTAPPAGNVTVGAERVVLTRYKVGFGDTVASFPVVTFILDTGKAGKAKPQDISKIYLYDTVEGSGTRIREGTFDSTGRAIIETGFIIPRNTSRVWEVRADISPNAVVGNQISLGLSNFYFAAAPDADIRFTQIPIGLSNAMTIVSDPAPTTP